MHRLKRVGEAAALVASLQVRSSPLTMSHHFESIALHPPRKEDPTTPDSVCQVFGQVRGGFRDNNRGQYLSQAEQAALEKQIAASQRASESEARLQEQSQVCVTW